MNTVHIHATQTFGCESFAGNFGLKPASTVHVFHLAEPAPDCYDSPARRLSKFVEHTSQCPSVLDRVIDFTLQLPLCRLVLVSYRLRERSVKQNDWKIKGIPGTRYRVPPYFSSFCATNCVFKGTSLILLSSNFLSSRNPVSSLLLSFSGFSFQGCTFPDPKIK